MADQQPGVAQTPSQTTSPPPAEAEVEVVESTPAQPAAKGNGFEQVDLPPEAQKRFDRLYRQIKAQDKAKMLQGVHLTQLTDTVSRLQAELAAEKSKDAVTSLRAQIKEARESGDEERVEKLRDQLVEVQAEAAVQKRTQPKEAPKQALEAPAMPEISRSDTAAIKRWSVAADDNGKYLRPWTQEGHRDVDTAAQHLVEVLNSEEFEDHTIEEKLAEVDRRMGFKKAIPTRKEGNAVLGADLTGSANKDKPSLTRDQAEVAEKLYPNLSPADARKRYYASLQSIKGK